MKISYNWLQEYFDKPLPAPKELADLLNVRAFEVEEVEEVNGDSVFEIKITPDRAPDCLSHLGVAREVSVHTKLPLVLGDIPAIEVQFETECIVEAQEKTVQRYMAREFKNVHVTESPAELKTKLEAIGQRSINTIVDITNLVMFEIGQPMHAFDTDKVSGKKILVAAPQNSNITTLDGKEVELTAEDITIQDSEGNLAIAGVKGGKKAEVNLETKNIILESANFFPVKVRKTSKRVAIQNDSSKRFENGLTPKLAEKGIALASHYIQKYASSADTQASNIIDVYPRPQPRPYMVGLNLQNVTKKIGQEIPEVEILNILAALNISYKKIDSIEEMRAHVDQTLGTPYVFGASVLYDSPRAFDCSSLMSYLYGFVGVSLPRMSVDQFAFSKPITRDELVFGDLVFSNSETGSIFYETKDFIPGTKIENGVDHVGMYLGDGKILHASRHLEGGTSIQELDSAPSFKNGIAYRRVLTAGDFPRYILQIPYERLDLKTEIDIIEEIGRCYGYEHIVPTAPAQIDQTRELSVYDKLVTLKSALMELGFDEVVTYSFQKKGDIAVTKPLAKDKGYARKTLVTGLTDALDLNFRNKELFAEDTVRIFEIGHVFTEEGEKAMLGVAVRSAHKKTKAKQLIEDALKSLSEKIGVEVNATIADNQEVVEIDLASILESMKTPLNSLYPLSDKKYVPFSPYPFMTRDIAVWASAAKTKQDIESVITEHAGSFLLRYDLFDEFSKDGKTSYAYRLVFQSAERTLTDEEVNPIMDRVYQTLQTDPDFEIR